MNPRVLVAAFAVLASTAVFAGQAAKPAAGPHVVVYKSPTCGCCGGWIQHMRSAGFQVEAHDVTDDRRDAVAKEAGVGDELRSCHTAKVDGYVVEGHVPAADIQKMLKEKPKITGIAAPGMPVGSPGMEQGGQKDPYDTVAFTKGGAKTVYVKHR